MASTQQLKQSTITENFDLVLQVGSPVEAELRVSSSILINSSKVFAALLSPRFLESQRERSTSEPQSIPLPEDDAGAMENLCLLLHGKVPSVLDFNPSLGRDPICDGLSALVPLAEVTDKYRCAETLHLQFQGLFYGAIDLYRHEKIDHEELAHVVIAAYYLNHSRCFQFATHLMIMEDVSALTGHEYGGKNAPTQVFDAIESIRVTVREKVAHDLPDQVTNLEDLKTAFYTNQWPCERYRLSESLGYLDNLRLNSFRSMDSRSFAGELRRMCSGLCLRCIRTGTVQVLATSKEEVHQ